MDLLKILFELTFSIFDPFFVYAGLLTVHCATDIRSRAPFIDTHDLLPEIILGKKRKVQLIMQMDASNSDEHQSEPTPAAKESQVSSINSVNSLKIVSFLLCKSRLFVHSQFLF